VDRDPAAAVDPSHFFEHATLSGVEAACAFRLPFVFSGEDRGLPVRRVQSLPAPSVVCGGKTSVVFGVNRHRGTERQISFGPGSPVEACLLYRPNGYRKINPDALSPASIGETRLWRLPYRSARHAC